MQQYEFKIQYLIFTIYIETDDLNTFTVIHEGAGHSTVMDGTVEDGEIIHNTYFFDKFWQFIEMISYTGERMENEMLENIKNITSHLVV